ncbi:hypothetical protein SAMN05216317_10179 [Nitrosomonas eutropha]|uniref:hypothetical protein n=1 Tax=Nitrosomonas TaxID=914 RepID=UPI000895A68C|nr:MULTISPECIES: hypothetical protein [Nitrosomonas]SDW00131.1 hypothetical protein SAMN05216317_10179 [Nitrosomonas eutropha]
MGVDFYRAEVAGMFHSGQAFGDAKTPLNDIWYFLLMRLFASFCRAESDLFL